MTRRRRTGPLDLQLGGRIRALRLARGLTQEDLARRIGVTFQQVQKYETGANRISAANILATCEALAVDPNHLLDVAGDPPPSKEALELARLFSAMDPHRRLSLLNVARALAVDDTQEAA